MKGRRHVNAHRGRSDDPFVFGVRPVGEYLRANPDRIAKVLLLHPDRRREIADLASDRGIEVAHINSDEMDVICGAENHQGVVALLRPFEYSDVSLIAATRPPILVAADGIEDPRNLGALIRSSAAAGAGGIVIPRDRAAPVTAMVEKAAAGTTAWFPVCQVTNLVRTLEDLKEKFKYWVIGLSAGADQSVYEGGFPAPAIVVIGGEGGMRPLVARTCDLVVRIPMDAKVESLNLAVAGAVALFELRRQLGGSVLTGTRSGARKHDSHQN